jgi:hypothetical protein
LRRSLQEFEGMMRIVWAFLAMLLVAAPVQAKHHAKAHVAGKAKVAPKKKHAAKANKHGAKKAKKADKKAKKADRKAVKGAKHKKAEAAKPVRGRHHRKASAKAVRKAGGHHAARAPYHAPHYTAPAPISGGAGPSSGFNAAFRDIHPNGQ